MNLPPPPWLGVFEPTPPLIYQQQLMVFGELFFAKFPENNFRKISHHFCIFSLNLFSRKNTKFREKVCKIRRRSFHSVETLIVVNVLFWKVNLNYIKGLNLMKYKVIRWFRVVPSFLFLYLLYTSKYIYIYLYMIIYHFSSINDESISTLDSKYI